MLAALSGQGSGVMNVMQGTVLRGEVPPLYTDGDPAENLLSQ